ncbi:hypothetical protein K435DRAFT_960139 [Dendrothele bispora CBS 962.96]|uniref:Uncharacterized protein n=1 Tax=Dendrothele bispora (strain CBS 962.96) TaxID=1314807 RepID=A0A4V4HIJ9_DENBC|nr:hypothetical protein K435DRAFT_960139 [Dendrothele bispora CBS 962.96]
MAKSDAANPAIGTKGKRRKHFLEQNDAMQLANSIANVQEEKAMERAEKRHQERAESTKSKSPRKSASKTRLLEIKAQIASDRAKKKKRLKAAPTNTVTEVAERDILRSGSRHLTRKNTSKKRVSFG